MSSHADPVLPCERCERAAGTEIRGDALLCESCADERDQATAERDAAKFHGGTDAWPLHLRGLV